MVTNGGRRMRIIKWGLVIFVVVFMGVLYGCAGSEKIAGDTGSSDQQTQNNGKQGPDIITGNITPPKPIKSTMVTPKYPKSAKQDRMEGNVKINFVVSKEGVPEKIYVVNGLRKDCDEACLKAIKKWLFLPALKDGKPVAVYYEWEFFFHLK